MGTGKSGRYLNTKGSGKSASDFAVIHSSERTLKKSQERINGKMHFKMRLVSGGHRGFNQIVKQIWYQICNNQNIFKWS